MLTSKNRKRFDKKDQLNLACSVRSDNLEGNRIVNAERLVIRSRGRAISVVGISIESQRG